MYYYILNPASGGGRINKVQERLKLRLKELGIAGEFVKSIGEGDITKLTLLGIKRGYKTIVAVGGDGTINEVINGIGDHNVALGIIPIGTTNELAKTLGITDWQSACNILASRKIEEVDLGKIGQDFFVTSVNIGFDSDISNMKPVEDSSPLEKILYFKKALTAGTNFKPKKAILNFDDKFTVETEYFNIQVSNGHFSPIPRTKNNMQDNLLDVIIVGKMPYRKTLKYILNPQTIDSEKDVSVFRTKKVTIKCAKAEDVAADGRVLTKTPVLCRVADRKLRVIVSKKRKF